MNSQTLFSLLGKVIASTGSRNFPRLLHDLVQAKLPVDATRFTQIRAKDVGLIGEECNTIGAQIHGIECMNGLVGCEQWKFLGLSNDLRLIDSQVSASRLNFSFTVNENINNDLAPIIFSSQLHLQSKKDKYFYIISLYRTKLQNFSAQEHIILKDISSLLLPLIEKHINAKNPHALSDNNINAADFVHESGEATSLRQRFEERLVRSGLHLSNREKEVCTGLLAGRTAPELAEALGLKVNTVESYLKRAVIKMGISGRHSLVRWMHATPATLLTSKLPE